MIDQKQPTIQALVLLHSIDEKTFELVDITFPYTNAAELQAAFEKESKISQDSNRFKQLVDNLCALDGLMEMATEDLGAYGDVGKEIHKELWDKNPTEQYHCINVDLFYSESRDYWTGEVDVDIDYEYEISSIEKEWQHLNLLQKDSKIYYIDYEESGTTYTIAGIHTVTDNELLQSGLWYDIHSDQLPAGTGYYSIPVDIVDSDNITDRFFSTSELAHEAYIKFQEMEIDNDGFEDR